MIVAIDFADGRVREVDTSQAASALVRGSELPLALECELRIDLLCDSKRGELAIDVYQRLRRSDEEGAVFGIGGVVLPGTARAPVGTIVISDAKEMAAASLVTVQRAGQSVAAAWRQGSGNWVVNGVRFAAARRLYYTDAATTSTNSQAIVLADYVRSVEPELDNAGIAAAIGYPAEALAEVATWEASNVPEEDWDDADPRADA